jgi:hypothetical protein
VINIPLFINSGLILLSHADKSVKIVERCTLSGTSSISETCDSKGYTDIVSSRDKFIAVGTDGRIDISLNPEKYYPSLISIKIN